MIKVSVIVPIYNVESLLPICLDSIKGQTLNDFECLLIDDGSTDNSGRICDEYVNKDARFKVIHTLNRGASAARNLGLDNAKGEWIQFVDSDDWVEGNFLQNFFEGTTESDIIFQGFYSEVDNRPQKKVIDAIPEEKMIDTLIRLEQNDILGWTFCKMFLHSIIAKHHIRFQKDVSLREDMIFTLEYLLHVDSIGLSAGCGYHYVIRQGSLMKSPHTFQEVDRCNERVYNLRKAIAHKFASEQYEKWIEEEHITRKLKLLKHLYYPQTGFTRKDRMQVIKAFRISFSLNRLYNFSKLEKIMYLLFQLHLPYSILDSLINSISALYYRQHFKQ